MKSVIIGVMSFIISASALASLDVNSVNRNVQYWMALIQNMSKEGKNILGGESSKVRVQVYGDKVVNSFMHFDSDARIELGGDHEVITVYLDTDYKGVSRIHINNWVNASILLERSQPGFNDLMRVLESTLNDPGLKATLDKANP